MNDMPTRPWTNPRNQSRSSRGRRQKGGVMSRVDGGQTNGVVEREAAEEGMSDAAARLAGPLLREDRLELLGAPHQLGQQRRGGGGFPVGARLPWRAHGPRDPLSPDDRWQADQLPD